MKNRNPHNRLHIIRRTVSLTALMAGCLSLLITAAAHAEPEVQQPTLSVRGEAILRVDPDQVTVSIGVLSEARQAKQALAKNSQAMQKVIAAIVDLGLSKKDYKTRQLSVQPKWSARPRDSSSSRWRPEIIGYTVTNTLQVTTGKLALVGDLISVATVAGANQIQSIRFGLSNPREYRSQAIAKAVANARADADTAAQAAGTEIDGIKTLHLDHAASVEKVQDQSLMMRSAVAAEAAAVPPVNPGEVTIRASVSVVYRLDE